MQFRLFVAPAVRAYHPRTSTTRNPDTMPTPQEINKQNVMDFYDCLINRKDFDAARAHVGPGYTQHNPLWPSGIDGMKTFAETLRRDFPDAKSEIKRAFADGDFVILHIHSVRTPGSRGRAIVDIFRMEHGKIVEHWDVIQDIPETSANPNGMF